MNTKVGKSHIWGKLVWTHRKWDLRFNYFFKLESPPPLFRRFVVVLTTQNVLVDNKEGEASHVKLWAGELNVCTTWGYRMFTVGNSLWLKVKACGR